MAADSTNSADARLALAAHERGYADPRPPLRERLRELKDAHPDAFRRAREHYAQVVAPALGTAPDPLAEWVEYARFLGGLSAPGRLLAIDAGGGARPYASPDAGLLLLYVPDDTAVAVLVAAAPAEPSPAQQATLDLLVERRLAL